LFNFLARYQIPTKIGTFGATLGTTVTSSYFLDYNGFIEVLAQFNIDLTLFYKTKDERLEARLAFLNLTDEETGLRPTRSTRTARS
jgi:outer membrane receptor protein involved in Fe transport